MIDFYEGWNLRNRLINDGYMSPYEDASNGREMEQKIYKLAKEHYNWEPAEPSRRMDKISLNCREELQNQTANDRLCYIWEVGADWDGYRTLRGLGDLLDEILDYTAIPCKTTSQVISEIKIFNSYDTISDFLNLQHYPLYWSYPKDKCNEIMEYCKENNMKVNFICENRDNDGNLIAIVLKIKRKDNKNDIV